MFKDLYRLHMQPGVVGTLRGQDLLKENAVIGIGGCMLGHCRLFGLLQATTEAVFTNTYVDTMLHGPDIPFPTLIYKILHIFPMFQGGGCSRLQFEICIYSRLHKPATSYMHETIRYQQNSSQMRRALPVAK